MQNMAGPTGVDRLRGSLIGLVERLDQAGELARSGARRGRDDFRGAASSAPPSVLVGGLPLGRFVSPQSGHGPQVHLPLDALERHAVVVGPWWRRARMLAAWTNAALAAGFRVVTVDHFGWQRWSIPYGAECVDPTRADSAQWDWLADALAADALTEVEDGLLLRPGRGARTQVRDRSVLRGVLELQRDGNAPAGVLGLHATLTSPPALRRAVAVGQGTNGAARLAMLALSTNARIAHAGSAAAVALAPLLTRRAERASRPGTVSVGEVVGRPGHLIVDATRTAGRILASLMLALALDRADRDRQRVAPGILVVAPNARLLEPRADLAVLMDVARSAGICFALGYDEVPPHRTGREVFHHAGTAIVHAGAPRSTAAAMSARTDGALSAREIGVPAFRGLVATVHSPGVGTAPFLIATRGLRS